MLRTALIADQAIDPDIDDAHLDPIGAGSRGCADIEPIGRMPCRADDPAVDAHLRQITDLAEIGHYGRAAPCGRQAESARIGCDA